MGIGGLSMKNCVDSDIPFKSGSACVGWIETYLGDRVCNVRDGVSLLLGLISVISWTAAEFPQIITNFKEKSTEGISILFLLTWFIGDIFNVIGCWLEPATIPTQFYTALLYSITTSLLLFQSIYYRYIRRWWLVEKNGVNFKLQKLLKGESDQGAEDNDKSKAHKKGLAEPLNSGDAQSRQIVKTLNNSMDVNKAPGVSSEMRLASTCPVPIVLPWTGQSRTGGRDTYMSARSLGNSYTPSVGSYGLTRSPYCSRSPGLKRKENLSADPEHLVLESEGLEAGLLSQAASVSPNTEPLFCTVGALFVVGVLQAFLPTSENAAYLRIQNTGFRVFSGRKLLQVHEFPRAMLYASDFSKRIGTFMGWGMAAIYMGGRLPQIYLNTKRGTAEGLNPLMFIIAIIANSTYVGSILVRSIRLTELGPNMPWLVDAFGCVLLDCFIVAQSYYFQHHGKGVNEDVNGLYKAIK